LAPLVTAVFLLFPAMYVGSYLTLKNDPAWIVDDSSDHIVVYTDYRWGGSCARAAYMPLYQADRWLWPDYWNERSHWLHGSYTRYWPPGRRIAPESKLVVGLDPAGQIAAYRDLRFTALSWNEQMRAECENPDDE
jgi:hypothetical protein